MIRCVIKISCIGLVLFGCGGKGNHQSQVPVPVDSIPNLIDEKQEISMPPDGTVRVSFLDSILEVNYRVFRTVTGKMDTTGINIVDHQKKQWLFDSEGPQLESYSDFRKVTDSSFLVSVYYDFELPNHITKKVKIARYNLLLKQQELGYLFFRDSLFKPLAILDQREIQKAKLDYQELIESPLPGNNNSVDQQQLNRMFEVQLNLLAAFISGCDSCHKYSVALFDMYDDHLFAADSDYAGEIASVFLMIGNKDY